MVFNNIVTQEQAQEVIAQLLVSFSSNAAQGRMANKANTSKQSVDETARRTAGNLLSSFVTQKPGGFVDTY